MVQSTRRSRPILSGLVTGAIAGIIMAVVMMLVYWLFLRKGPLYPVQVIGSFALGEIALVGTNMSAVLAGLVIHMIPSLLWGLIFGLVANGLNIMSESKALIYGLILGAVMMIDVYVFVPIIMGAVNGTNIWSREVPMFWDWAAHLVFGASFVVYPAVNRWLNKTNANTRT